MNATKSSFPKSIAEITRLKGACQIRSLYPNNINLEKSTVINHHVSRCRSTYCGQKN